jgi:hypothetical protein
LQTDHDGGNTDLPPRRVEAGYLNVLITLAKSIDEFLAGYQLRITSMPKLESAAPLQGKICV